MKKIIPTLLIAAAAFTIVACTKKDDDPTGNYTCKCRFTVPSSSFDSTYNIPFNGVKKSYATSSCKTANDEYNSMYVLLGGSASCSL